MAEIWKSVTGFGGYYEVSDKGAVRSLGRVDSGGYRRRGRTMKLGRHGYGYAQVRLSRDGKSKNYLVHRLVAEAFLENPQNLPSVLHGAEGHEDNSVSNLRWGTQRDNLLDSSRRDGTHAASSKTECKNGHPFDAENTYIRPDGFSRDCRKCRVDRNRRYLARKSGNG